jgi:uncharacterized membrane protein YhaH (DUF805 family)
MPLAQMPGKDPHGLFPRLLSRRSYFIRWMVLFVLTVVIFVGCAVANGPIEVVQAWLVVGGLYSLFGLHVPRWRDAGLSPWLTLLFVLSVVGTLVLQIILFVKPSRVAGDTSPPESMTSESRIA